MVATPARISHRPWTGPLSGYGAPLALVWAGLAVGSAVHRGPTSWLSIATYALGVCVFVLSKWLARRGRQSAVAVAIVAGALLTVPMAFGPSERDNRKVTAFNAWAYDAGASLPGLAPTAVHPNSAGGLLAVALVLVAGSLRWPEGRVSGPGPSAVVRKDDRKAWIERIAALLLVGALFLTAARAAWLAAGVGLTVLALWPRSGTTKRRRLRIGAVVALACAGVVALAVAAGGAPPPGSPAMWSSESGAMRLEQWRLTAGLLAAGPTAPERMAPVLIGLGPGRFPDRYRQGLADAMSASAAGAAAAKDLGEATPGPLPGPSGGREAPFHRTPNNGPLLLWSEAGLLGLAGLALAIVRTPRLVRVAGPSGRPFFAAMAALSVHAIFESNFVWTLARDGGFVYLVAPVWPAILGVVTGLSSAASRNAAGARP